MYYAIIATAGYVEMSQLAYTTWVNQQSCFEDPILALKSLSEDLLIKYLSESEWPQLFENNWAEIPTCHRYSYGPEPICEKCGEQQRPSLTDADPESFQQWVCDLSKQDADSFGEEMCEWWPWNTFEEIKEIPNESTICIPENFEKFVVTACDSQFLTDDERKLFLEYREERGLVLPEVNIKESKICELDTRYPHWEKSNV